MDNAAAGLLRLLEPAVRPNGLPAGGPVRPPAAPFESRSFASLMQEFGAADSAPPAAPPSGTPLAEEAAATPLPATSPLAPLGGMDRIENPTLRELLARPAA